MASRFHIAAQMGRVAQAMLKLGDFVQPDETRVRPAGSTAPHQGQVSQYAADRELAQLKVVFYQTFGYWPSTEELDAFIEEGY